MPFTYFVDLENGIDTQSGGQPIVKTGSTVTAGSTSITVPSNAGIVVGMRVFSTDLNNSGLLVVTGVTVASISGNSITISAQAIATSANATLVFSPALKTIGAAYGKVAAGDTIRVKTSRITNTGLTGNWQNKSVQLTYTGTAPYKVIDQCEVAWSNNGLGNGASIGTVSNIQGTASVTFTLNSYTTTNNGVVAYKTLPQTLDLSAYTRVSLLLSIYSNGGAGTVSTDGSYFLDLCSDTLGQTPVHSISVVPAGSSLRSFSPFIFDNGAALGSSIRSLALRRTGGTTTSSQTGLALDNIVAVKSLSEPSAISHRSVLSQSADGDEWWPVVAFEDTYIQIGSHNNQAGWGTSRGYYGNPGGYPIYKMEQVPVTAANTSTAVANADSPITLSGGWDALDMSTRTGLTGITFDFLGSIDTADSYYVYENLVLYRSAGNQSIAASTYRNFHVIGRGVSTAYALVTGFLFDKSSVIQSNTHGVLLDISLTCLRAIDSKFISCAAQGGYTPSTGVAAHRVASRIEFLNCELSNNGTYGFETIKESYANAFTNCEALDNVTASFALRGKAVVKNTLVDTTNPVVVTGGYQDEHEIRFHNFNRTLNDHRIYSVNFRISSETNVRHAVSGLAWKIQPLSTNVDEYFPAKMSIGQVLCDANKLVTVSLWVRRDSLVIQTGLRIRYGQIAGISDDLVALATGPANTWEQVTLAFTPTVVGVVDLEFIAYGGTTLTAYCDDLTVTQSVS